jgi:TolB-like protein
MVAPRIRNHPHMGEILRRLRERKLVQWALAYVAAAFALIQVLDVVAQRFGWPEALERVLILALAIGFLIVLVLAWYHGERGAQRVSGTELLILALLLVIGGAALWRFSAPSVTPASATASGAQDKGASGARDGPIAAIPQKSIAVLPFTDLSPGRDQEYFSDGMAEEILGALTKIKDLKVAGRTSSFSFRGKNEDLRVIGKALAVAHVLEGSVRKQGDRVRVTAQLIQIEDGYRVWSETYDGDLKDVFELQERIARAIVGQLQVVLQGDQQKRLVSVATTNAEAYSLYLQASAIFSRREGPRLPEAIGELEQALKLDPKFARAHSRLAAIHAIEPIYTPSLSDVALAVAEHEAALAIELDPTLAEPHATLALAYVQRGRYVDARIAVERALAVDPDDATTNLWAGINFTNSGYTTKGCAMFDHALSIDPLLPNALLWRGIEYAYEGNVERAEVLLRRAADVGLAHVGVGLDLVYAMHGDRDEARKQLESGLRVLGAGMPLDAPEIIAAGVYGDSMARTRAVEFIDQFLTTRPSPVPGILTYSLLMLGENSRAVALLAQGPSSNDALFLHFVWSPSERSLRALPEFKTYTRKSGLAELWDRFGEPDACRRLAPGDYDCTVEAASTR